MCGRARARARVCVCARVLRSVCVCAVFRPPAGDPGHGGGPWPGSIRSRRKPTPDRRNRLRIDHRTIRSANATASKGCRQPGAGGRRPVWAAGGFSTPPTANLIWPGRRAVPPAAQPYQGPVDGTRRARALRPRRTRTRRGNDSEKWAMAGALAGHHTGHGGHTQNRSYGTRGRAGLGASQAESPVRIRADSGPA